MEYKIEQHTLDIDVEATRAMYEAMPDSEVRNSKDLNFLRFLSSDKRVLPFFQAMGIDPRKAVPDFVPEAHPEKQALYYCVCFPICRTTDAPISDLEEGCVDCDNDHITT